MPLSRLAPRSSATGLSRKKKNTSSNDDTQRHLYLWTAIRKTQEEINVWQRQVDQVEGLFAKYVAPREQQLTKAVSDLTEKLMQHFETTELEIADKSLLGLWICDNLSSLYDHPFGDPALTGALRNRWLVQLNNDGLVENQLAKLTRNYSTDEEPTHRRTEPIIDEAFSDDDATSDVTSNVDKANLKSDEDDTPESASDSTTHKDEDEAVKATSNPDLADTISSLEDKLSVERLFRQLAKVLHPDREQDEEAKAAKHVLMSEVLEARKNKDINALLTLYCEHVGELPDDMDLNSHNELVAALEQQLKQLQLELRTKRFSDPLLSMIVERYSSSNTVDCEQRINNHASSLDAEIEAAMALSASLSSHDGLLDALVERRAVEQDKHAINELTGY